MENFLNSPIVENFFSLVSRNLLSFFVGVTYGLVSYRWNPWRTWIKVVVYFVLIAVWYAAKYHFSK